MVNFSTKFFDKSKMLDENSRDLSFFVITCEISKQFSESVFSQNFGSNIYGCVTSLVFLYIKRLPQPRKPHFLKNNKNPIS